MFEPPVGVCFQWPDQGHPINERLVMADVTDGREPGLAWAGLGRGNGTQGRLSTELPAARFSWPVPGPTRPSSSSKHLPEERSLRRLRTKDVSRLD